MIFFRVALIISLKQKQGHLQVMGEKAEHSFREVRLVVEKGVYRDSKGSADSGMTRVCPSVLTEQSLV